MGALKQMCYLQHPKTQTGYALSAYFYMIFQRKLMRMIYAVFAFAK